MQIKKLALPSSVFERIRQATGSTDPARADELLAALRAELVEIESAVALAPQVIEGDAQAETSFRGLLDYAGGTSAESEDEQPVPVHKRRMELRPHTGGVSFAGADVFAELSVAAALIANDEADWEKLSSQILALSECSEWFEELAATAGDRELAEFQSLAALFLRDRSASDS